MRKKKPKLSKEQKQFLKSMEGQFNTLMEFVSKRIKWVGEEDFKDQMFDGSPDGSYAVFSIRREPELILKEHGTYDCFDTCAIFDDSSFADAYMKYNVPTHAILADLVTGHIVKEESRSYSPGCVEPISWNNWVRRSAFAKEQGEI